MSSEDVTVDMLTAVSQYIGARLDRYGDFKCDLLWCVRIDCVTWDWFVSHIYDHMVRNFIIEKVDSNTANAGLKWLTSQNWKK